MIPLRLSFLFKKVVVCGHCLVTLSLTVNETEREIQRERERQRQTDRQTETKRQTERDRHRERQREREREREDTILYWLKQSLFTFMKIWTIKIIV